MKKNFLLFFLLIIIIAGCGKKEEGQIDEVARDSVQEKTEVKLPPKIDVGEITLSDHVLGNADAKVSMIIYSEFECPFCAEFEASNGPVAQARDYFGDDLRIIFRHNPLPFSTYSQIAAEASECANEQGKFWEMHDLLFKDYLGKKLNPEQIYQNAEILSLDNDQFRKCLDDEKYQALINNAKNEARQFGADATPTSFINGYIVVGATPFENYETEEEIQLGLKTIIEKVLAE